MGRFCGILLNHFITSGSYDSAPLIKGCIVEFDVLAIERVMICHLFVCSGDRAKIKTLVKELNVSCLDTGGHTPLMYAVMGRQAKVSRVWNFN